MISALDRLVDLVEEHLTEEFDVDGLARALGTTRFPDRPRPVRPPGGIARTVVDFLDRHLRT